MSDFEDLAYPPHGGRLKQWLVGVGVALVPIVYAIYSLHRDRILLPALGRGIGPGVYLSGRACIALAIAYMGIGMFAHFHWFWGLSDRLERFCTAGKVAALLLVLGGISSAWVLALID